LIPKAEARRTMPATSLNCPECEATLRLANPVAPGKKLKCPRCAAIFAVPAEDEEEIPAAIVAKPRASAPRPRVADEDDEEIPVAKVRKRAQPIEDDEDDESVDDEPEDRPRRKGKKRKKEAKKSRGLLIVLVIAGAALLFLGGGAAVVILFFMGGDTNRGTGTEDPLAYIPGDSSFIVGVDFGQLYALPGIGPQIEQNFMSAGDSNLRERFKQETGSEFKEVFDRAIFAFKPSPQNPRVQEMTVVVMSKVSFNQKKVRNSFTSKNNVKAEAKKHQGKTYFKVDDPNLPWAFMPSDNLLIGSNMAEDKFKNVVASNGSQLQISADAASLAKQGGGSAAWVAVPIGNDFKQMVNAGGAGMGVPGLDKQIANLKAFGLWGAAEGKNLNLTVRLVCADDNTAKSISAQIPGIKAMAGMFMQGPQKDLLQDLVNSLQSTVNGSNVDITAKVGIDKLGSLGNLGPMMGGGMGGAPPGGMPGRPGGPGGGLPGRPGGGAGGRPGGVRPPGG
jgi:hypothetical protein